MKAKQPTTSEIKEAKKIKEKIIKNSKIIKK